MATGGGGGGVRVNAYINYCVNNYPPIIRINGEGVEPVCRGRIEKVGIFCAYVWMAA